MELTEEIIRQISSRAKQDIIDGILDHADLLEEFNIHEGLRRQHFLAQLAHESDGFRTTREYASGAAYEGRDDLGNTEEGDGVRYRGRGLIQLTGRANYRTYSEQMDVDLEEFPELAEEFPYALLSAVLYWEKKGLNKFADEDNLIRITKRINGGTNGLEDRRRYLERCKDIGL